MTIDISRALTIPGWMSPTELIWLAERAAVSPRIIEIGAFKGRTTRVLGDHVPPGGRVYSVDPWASYVNDEDTEAKWIFDGNSLEQNWEDIYQTWRRNVADLLELNIVCPVRTQSLDPRLRYNLPYPQAVEFIFLDGDHRADTVVWEIAEFMEWVRPGGILAGHDYTHTDWPGVKQAVDAAFPEGVNVVDSIWWVQL